MYYCAGWAHIKKREAAFSQTKCHDCSEKSPNTQIDFAQADEQTGPHIFLIGTRGRAWTLGLYLKVHFSASSQHCRAGPLNCCKVSSHTHLTLLSHWVQTAFVTSTQQGFPLASIYTLGLGGWLPALLISSFAPPAFLKATEMFPLCTRDRWLVKSKDPDSISDLRKRVDSHAAEVLLCC